MDSNKNPLEAESDAEQEELAGLEADIELQANKLLLLLHNSTMPEDVKESFVELLPAFSLQQLQDFIDILEAKYLDEKTKDIDEKLKKDLAKVVEEFEAQDEKDQEQLLKQINLISQKI